jgi:hypothetical protein
MFVPGLLFSLKDPAVFLDISPSYCGYQAIVYGVFYMALVLLNFFLTGVWPYPFMADMFESDWHMKKLLVRDATKKQTHPKAVFWCTLVGKLGSKNFEHN